MAFNIAAVEEFQDRRVRQAVSHAINTEAIVNQIYAGFATEASQPLPPNVLGQRRRHRAVPVRPRAGTEPAGGSRLRRRVLLRTGDVPEPPRIQPLAAPDGRDGRLNLGEVGIEVEINQQSFAPFLRVHAQGATTPASSAGTPTTRTRTTSRTYSYHPQVEESELTEGQDWVSFDTEGYNTSNRSAWANQEYMDLVEEGQQTTTESDRAELNEAMQIAHDDEAGVCT